MSTRLLLWLSLATGLLILVAFTIQVLIARWNLWRLAESSFSMAASARQPQHLPWHERFL